MRFLVVLLTLFALGCAKNEAQAPSQGGDSSSGGGSGTITEFFVYAKKSLSIIAKNGDIQTENGPIVKSYNRMHKTISSMTVKATTEQLRIHGNLVSAINYPSQMLIVVNIDDWKSLDSDGKTLLVSHEIFGLTFKKTEVDDTDFSVTRRIFTKNAGGQYPQAPETELQRERRKRDLRGISQDAVLRYAILTEKIIDPRVKRNKTSIIKNIVNPSDIDWAKHPRAEFEFSNEEKMEFGPYSLVIVYVTPDYINNPNFIEREYEVSLMADNTVVSIRLMGIK